MLDLQQGGTGGNLLFERYPGPGMLDSVARFARYPGSPEGLRYMA
jgi:hypothetical protein